MTTQAKVDLKELAARIGKSGTSLCYGTAELARILERLDVKLLTAAKGEVLAHEGDKATRIGFVLSGSLHLTTRGLDVESHLMRMVNPGEFLGLSMLFGQNVRYPADVVAFAASEIVVIEIAHLRKWRGQDLAAARFFECLAGHLSEALVASWQKAAVLSCSNIAERVMLYLAIRSRAEKSKTIVVPGSEADFANYLGVNASALSRVLSKLKADGRLTYRRNVLTLP